MTGQLFSHYSVLNAESIDFLTDTHCEESGSGKEKKIYADLTFGAGGHSFALLAKEEGAEIIGCDQDPDAFNNALRLIALKNYEKKIELLNFNFSFLPDYLMKKEIKIDGAIADLGVSSHQFDQGARGFSFSKDAPLDMRMNYADDGLQTAADIVNQYSQEKLLKIFFEYGEERYSRRIVERIIEARDKESIKTTSQLENIIFHAYPKKMRYGKINPSTRIFQALRIEVNSELKVLSDVIPQLLSCLKKGGRIVIISFHSLEDRIVKMAFKKAALEKQYKIIIKKPMMASECEINENFRSRSAKLRVIERL